MSKLRVLDLFCGAAGGWSLGLHRTGAYETIAACEIDDWRREEFSRKFPTARMYGDVRQLSGLQLLEDGLLDDGHGGIDIIVGSPPCQDASSANHRGKGIDGERTGLFLDALRLVRDLRPRWCAFENVPGIRKRGADRIIEGLETLDYTVWPLVVGADDAGANHRRKRVWFIAYANPSRWRFDGATRARWSTWGETEGPSFAYAADVVDRRTPAPWLVETIGERQARCGFSGGGESGIFTHPNQQRQHAGASHAAAVGRCAGAAISSRHDAADAHSSSIRVEPRRCGGSGRRPAGATELAAAFPWANWNGGPPHLDRVDARLSQELATSCNICAEAAGEYGWGAERSSLLKRFANTAASCSGDAALAPVLRTQQDLPQGASVQNRAAIALRNLLPAGGEAAQNTSVGPKNVNGVDLQTHLRNTTEIITSKTQILQTSRRSAKRVTCCITNRSVSLPCVLQPDGGAGARRLLSRAQAAYGAAVLPQITELIGRAILSWELQLAIKEILS